MKREITTRENGIIEFIDGLEKRKYLIPPFQREFVWEPRDIIRLWESIYNFYPIGNILCWETDIKLNIHRRPGGAILDDIHNKKDEGIIYILDGQQRATSLLFAINGGKTGHMRNRQKFDYSIFFDMKNREFFFAEEYSRRKKDIDPRFLVSLKSLFHKGHDLNNHAAEEQDYAEEVRESILQLRYAVTNYRLPLTYIRGFDIPAVSRIYELINQEGKALKPIDIMIAQTFKNYQYMVEEDM